MSTFIRENRKRCCPRIPTNLGPAPVARELRVSWTVRRRAWSRVRVALFIMRMFAGSDSAWGCPGLSHGVLPPSHFVPTEHFVYIDRFTQRYLSDLRHGCISSSLDRIPVILTFPLLTLNPSEFRTGFLGCATVASGTSSYCWPTIWLQVL